MTPSHGTLRMDLDSVRAAIARGVRAIQHFLEKTCKEYMSLVRTQSTSYHDCLNAVHAAAQLRGAFLRKFRERVR